MPKEIIIEVSRYTRKILTFYAVNLVEIGTQQLSIEDKKILSALEEWNGGN